MIRKRFVNSADQIDQVLLRSWVGHRDAEAFKKITTRHSDMVYAVCRRILGNSADAEDVVQECFLDLSLRTGAIRTSLAGWLHTVATRHALRRIRSEKRRKRRERHYAALAAGRRIHWQEIQGDVDEAIAALPEKLRDPIIRHFLEDESHEAIAEVLGVTRSAVSHRIAKGVEQLRKYLKRRGVPISAVALGTMLQAKAAEAAPLSLKAALGRLALAGLKAPAASVAVSPVLPGAFLGGIIAMKKVGILAGLLLASLFGLWIAVERPSPPEGTVKGIVGGNGATAALDSSAQFSPSPAETSRAANAGVIEEGVIIGFVYDTTNGEGIPEVTLSIEAKDGIPPFEASTQSDKTGHFRFERLKAASYIIHRGPASGYMSPRYSRNSRQEVSLKAGEVFDGVDFPVTIGVDIRGVVVNSSQNPVEGAMVKLFGGGTLSVYEETWSTEDGSFMFAGLPSEIRVDLKALVDSAASQEERVDLPSQGVVEVALILASIGKISGVIVDALGRPLGGLSVQCIRVPENSFGEDGMVDTTDAAGRFELTELTEGTWKLLGYRVQGEEEGNEAVVKLASGEHLVGLVLVQQKSSRQILGRVADPSGNPLSEVTVEAGSQLAMTDSEGRFIISDLGAGPFAVTAQHKVYGWGRVRDVNPGHEVVELILYPGYTISGQVIHAETRKPISVFEILCESHNYERFDGDTVAGFGLVRDPEGHFSFDKVEPGWVTTLAVRAPGFKTTIEVLRLKPGERLNLVLPLDPGGELCGLVTDPVGKPIPEAAIYLERPTGKHGPEAVTGPDGRFIIESFPRRRQRLTVTRSGYAPGFVEVSGESKLPELVRIGLQAPGFVEGKIQLSDGQAELMVIRDAAGLEQREKVGRDNTYGFAGLAPGEAELSVIVQYPEGRSMRTVTLPVLVESGEAMILDVDIPPARGVVQGTISMPSRRVEGYHVTLNVDTGHSTESQTIEVSAEGAYRLEHVAQGSASIKVVVYLPENNYTEAEPIVLERAGEGIVQRDILVLK